MSEPCDPQPTISIGHLSKATGIPTDTLRAWERRYGNPRPVRLPSGHRRYPMTEVHRLRWVATLLAQGRRPGELFRELERLDDDAELARIVQEAATIEPLLEHTLRFDGPALREGLLQHGRALPAAAFADGVLGPFLTSVGDAWEQGKLDVAHEHLASAIVVEVLSRIDGERPLAPAATHGTAVLACLPHERHDLALRMVAGTCSEAGYRTHLLGAHTPIESIARCAVSNDATVLCLHVSAASRDLAADALGDLVSLLPRSVRVAVGGAGATGLVDSPLATVLPDMLSMGRWLAA